MKASILRITTIAVMSGCISSAESMAVEENSNILKWRSPIEQPYAYVSGGSLSGFLVAASPDPLVNYVWDNPQASDHLQIFVTHPESAVAIEGENKVSGLETVSLDNCNIKVKGDCVIRVDFGKELPAWMEIDSPDLNGTVTMGISEYNVPELINKTRTPIKHGNTYRLELNKEMYEGVRFGFIYVKNLGQPFTITSVRAVCQVKPVNYTGSFDCDNELINKIWYVGAWDVKANLREDCFGAILIDRGDRFSWTGDAYPAQAASLVAFSNYDEVLKNLYWTESHPNNIESYELYWVESLIDYYMFTGDVEGFKKLMPMAETRLKHAYEIYDNPQHLRFFGWGERTGRGFDHPDYEDNKLAYKMLAIGAWRHFAEMLQTIGEKAKAATYSRWANSKARIFANNPKLMRSLEMHSSADAINADLVSDLQEIYHPDFSDRLQRLSYSPFNEYMVINAMAKAGHYDDAFGAILDEWGEEINYGATCFLEVYRPGWNNIIEKNGPIPYTQAGVTSLAHPWGAGVTSWLTKEMLGIKPTSPGFKTFEVKPHLEGIASRVSGQLNTPNGLIKASFDLKSGLDTLVVPAGSTATLAIPKEGMKIEKIEVNGANFDFDETVAPSPENTAVGEADFVYLRDLTEGIYCVRVTYSGSPKTFVQQEWKYAVTDIKIDRTTQGEWFKKYGKGGRFIVCGTENRDDLQELPDYVESVSFDLAGTSISQHRTTSITALDPKAMIPVTSEPDARKVFGCYYSRSLQMCPAEIKVKRNAPYTVAVYFADCDKGGRDLAVDIIDLETGKLVAPTTRVSDFAGGVYMVFTYDRSVRVLANYIRGDNAVINAIYFDNGDTGSNRITTILQEEDSDMLYTLSGTPVERSAAKRGLYVWNGRKITMK